MKVSILLRIQLIAQTPAKAMPDQRLKQLLHSFKKAISRPDRSTYNSLFLADAITIAQQTSRSLLEVECLALQENIVPERYSRNQKSLSCKDQLQLLTSHVAIVGLGGLGGTVIELLARLGIGRLTLVDGDVFDESNLNRQILCTYSCLGQSKAKVAEARVRDINPALQLTVYPVFFSETNGQKILTGTDLAVDCLDDISTRFLLEKACKNVEIPLVSAAIAGFAGQATTIFPTDPGLKLIYGKREKHKQRGAEVVTGTLPFTATYMAAVECAEVLSILLKKPYGLRHRLFLAEVIEHSAEIVELLDSIT